MERLFDAYQSLGGVFAVISGMFTQYFFIDKKTRNRRVVATIVISSAFVALFFIPAIIDLINMVFKIDLKHDGNIAILLYASSSLISMELMSVLISSLKQGARDRITKFLGVDDGKKSNNKQE